MRLKRVRAAMVYVTTSMGLVLVYCFVEVLQDLDAACFGGYQVGCFLVSVVTSL